MVFSYLETRNNSLNYIYSNKKKNKISIYTKTKKANISARFLLVVMDVPQHLIDYQIINNIKRYYSINYNINRLIN